MNKVAFEAKDPTKIYSYTQSSLCWVHGENFPSIRSNHISLSVDFLIDWIRKGGLSISYVLSDQNYVDFLTKTVRNHVLYSIHNLIGIGGEI